MQRIEKSWGYEEVIYNERYCCKKLVYTRRIASSLHYHNFKHETFVVATGKFTVERTLNGAKEHFEPGDSIVLSPGQLHRVTCLEPGFIVEASTHDTPDDCVRLVPSQDLPA